MMRIRMMKKRSDLHAGRALLRAGLQSHVFMAELLEFQSKLRGGSAIAYALHQLLWILKT
jgi:hypothetical protein